MTNITIPTTQVADTGTGAVMVPYNLAGDTASFRESAPVGAPAFLNMKRTEPKATKAYAGAARGEVKFTRQVADTNGVLWPAVVTTTSSLPAFLTDTAKAAFVTEAILALGLPVSNDALAKLVIPQS